MASISVTRNTSGADLSGIDDGQPDGRVTDGLIVGFVPDDAGAETAAIALGLAADAEEPQRLAPQRATPTAGGVAAGGGDPDGGFVTSAAGTAINEARVSAGLIVPLLGFETDEGAAEVGAAARDGGVGSSHPEISSVAPTAGDPLAVAGGFVSDVAIPTTGARLAPAPTFSIVDIIPFADSAETDQGSEPSLAVNPLNTNQIIAGAFSGSAVNPFWLSTNGGTTWTDFGTISHSDKSLAWKADGSGFLVATLNFSGNIETYAATTGSAGFGSPINTFGTTGNLDQPWIRAGGSNHVYVAYNNLNSGGKTASVNVSIDGGSTYTPTVIDQVGGSAVGFTQDMPSIRLAINGSRVYAVFTRPIATVENDSAGYRLTSQIVVVRDDNAGADSFKDLGALGAGTTVATPTAVFSLTDNSALTLGLERTGGDVAIAVDPANANHIVVAYGNSPGANGSGQLQLTVAESTDGGANWTTKFTTSSSFRAALPALAILPSGTVGFLYGSYTPGGANPNADGTLAVHFLETADDFANNSDTVLALESNLTPTFQFDPYLGDFFDLEGFGSTFYGTFSASNRVDGTSAAFVTNPIFQRATKGTEGTGTFQVTTTGGTAVGFSIDPYFFTAGDIACFCRGTRIMTNRGEVAVEDLAIGDTVVTLSGALRPIKWIGRRAYDGRFIAGNRSVLPVRIAAGALGAEMPARDLWVSPEHALYLDGVLAAARLLINGTTIARAEWVAALEYFHIELDAHDIILAEGTPAESYVERDNRTMFANAVEFARLYPADRSMPAEFCAPRVAAGAAELASIRAALAAGTASAKAA